MNDMTTESVEVFNLTTHKFNNSASLNQARCCSSSTIAGETIYVFGGYNNNGFLDTIEALDVTSPSSKWGMNSSENFTARRNAVVCSLSVDRILICGGLDGGHFNDVLVFDTKTKITKKVADAPINFDNNDINQAYIERDGVVLALVKVEDKGNCLVRIGIDPDIFEVITDRF